MLSIAPSFAQAPAGGPRIEIGRVRGVLRRGTDSIVAEATIRGDSAFLEFAAVPVGSDGTLYQLLVQAFDPANVLVFEAEQEIEVKPGANEPAAPQLEYVAPDASVTSINITDAVVALDWAGALAGDNSCLNRAPKTPAVVQKQLTLSALGAGGQPVSGVRAGWTSRDTAVATVDANGLVRARCSNKSTWVVARTFLDLADSVRIEVTAPPFALVMSPDSTNVARGASRQLTALVVDENGNSVAASAVNWASSNAARATVSSTGVVTGVTNGRVLITARSGDRTTVGVVQVVRPPAASVITIPQQDSMAAGSVQAYYAKAADANGNILGDATTFAWSSSNTGVATVNASGVVSAVAPGTAGIIAMLDGKADTVALQVKTSLPGGTLEGRILDAATDAPLPGVSISAPGTSATTDASGAFSLANVQPGDNITVTKTGYAPVTIFDAPVFRGVTIRFGDAGLPPAGGTGTVTGKVLNALNQQPVSGITVKAYAGLNAAPSPKRPDPAVVATASTNASGTYTFASLPAGAYTLHFSSTGYSQNVTFGSAVNGMTETLADVQLPPAAAGSGLVVVVTWGPNATNVPADLDAHLTGPIPAGGRFHVYSAARAQLAGSDTVAALEADDVSYVGPEVMSVRSSAPLGTYRFYVHNYSGRTAGTSRALADSAQARVDVYQDSRAIGTFFPPAGQPGTLWKVFEFDGARLFPVNQIVHQEDATTLPMTVGDSDLGDLSRIFSAVQALRKGR